MNAQTIFFVGVRVSVHLNLQALMQDSVGLIHTSLAGFFKVVYCIYDLERSILVVI